MKKQTRSFNVKMDEDQYAMLQQLATDAGLSKADLIRQSLSHRFQQQYAGLASCSNGNPCLCPQMHHATVIPKRTDAEVLREMKEADAA